MNLKIIIAFLSFLSFGTAYAQQNIKTEFSRRPEPNPKIRNLKIGDRVPEIIISKIIRDNKPNAKISEFKDKLLILDFWDTFCGSCIEALPKLDSLQKHFGNKIKILPVSYQAEGVMRAFFKTNKLIKNVNLPCVVEDKILGSHFQYKLISHEVWIYKGVVVALTGTDYVTAKNIQFILDGNKVAWPVKNDMVSFNPKKPIFAVNQLDQYNINSGYLQYSGITGHREGIDYKGGLTSIYDSLTKVNRTFFYNYTIVNAFNMLTFKLKPRNFILSPGRLILEVKDRAKYIYQENSGFPSDWNRNNQICYELVSIKPMGEQDKLQYIIDDLNHILKINVRWEKRKIKCWVLIKTKEIKNLDSLNEARKKTINGMMVDMSGVPLVYIDQNGGFPPGIDETNFKGNVILGSFSNLDGLRFQLQDYGCDVIEAERKIDVMVITEY